jgi:hypothetical protein
MGGIILRAFALAFAHVSIAGWTMHPPKPPLPGQPESCKQFSSIPDFQTSCENCADLELVSCDVYLGAEGAGNKATFTAKNHNTKYPRRANDVHFGHVGVQKAPAQPPAGGDSVKDFGAPPAEPTANRIDTNSRPDSAATPQPASAPVTTPAAGNVSLDVPKADTPHFQGPLPEYEKGAPDEVYAEAMPDGFVLGPQESHLYEIDGITDFPIIKACGDIVYMAVSQSGILDAPYLWNRNYSCTVLPCYQLNFRRCEVHRGGN